MSSGYPDDNPKTQFGMTKVPMHLVPPVAIGHMALAFGNGAGKYGPFNWREKTISSTVYYAAAMRHLQAWYDGEDIAPDSGVHHLAHAMACCAMVLDGESTGMLNDNRPPPGGFAAFLERHGAAQPQTEATRQLDAAVADMRDFLNTRLPGYTPALNATTEGFRHED